MNTYGWSHLSGVGNVTTLPESVPGGPNQAVQYNDGGNFNGNNTFTFDNTLGSEKITAPLIKVSNNVEPVVDGAGQVGTTVHKWGNINSVSATINNINSVSATINNLEVLNNVVPITTNTGQVGTVTDRWGNMNAVTSTFDTTRLNSIYDSTNSIGVTGYVLGNNLGNIVWQPSGSYPNFGFSVGHSSPVPFVINNNTTYPFDTPDNPFFPLPPQLTNAYDYANYIAEVGPENVANKSLGFGRISISFSLLVISGSAGHIVLEMCPGTAAFPLGSTIGIARVYITGSHVNVRVQVTRVLTVPTLSYFRVRHIGAHYHVDMADAVFSIDRLV
jgi:hypothetical protein